MREGGRDAKQKILSQITGLEEERLMARSNLVIISYLPNASSRNRLFMKSAKTEDKLIKRSVTMAACPKSKK